MKIYNYFFLAALVFLSACSSSDDGEPTQDLTAEINLSLNGQALNLEGIKYAYRDVHTITLGAENQNSLFFISFDENGNFGKLSYRYYEPLSNLQKTFTTSANFSSNYFNFNLEGYDPVGKRVKATFDGYVYYDAFNIGSESKFISGSFDLPIEDFVPTVVNRISEATINGNYWRATNSYQTRGNGGGYNNVTLNCMSDDQYRIAITFNDSYSLGTLPGTYSFTNASIQNKVQVAKFDVATSTYKLYDCSGTFTLLAKWNYCVQGTYSLTGVNPLDSNDVISIPDGKFKMIYYQY